MKPNQVLSSRRQGGYGIRAHCLIKTVPPRRNVPGEPIESATIQSVQRSLAYMEAHLNEPLSVATLATQANVSPSHFFALFKQLTGYPPMDYLTRLRMRQARKLLDSTSVSVKEVAAALGYQDPLYFSRVFKSFNKIPPSRYRVLQSGEALPDNRKRRSSVVTTV